MPAALIEVEAWDPVAATVETIRAASDDDPRLCALNEQRWWPVLIDAAGFALDAFSPTFPGFAEAPTGRAVLSLEAFPLAASYSFGDRPARIWIGEPGQAWPWTAFFDGLVTAARARDGRLDLDLRVNDAWLDRPVLPAYAGTGGLEGPAALAGAPKPQAFGAPRFIEPQLIDAVNLVYQFHGAGSAKAVVAALDRLVRYDPPLGDDASLSALVAASIPAGQWRTCLAHGLVRFGAPPLGPLTLIVEGDDGSAAGWIRRTGAMVTRIAALAGAPAGALDAGNLAALDAAAPWNVSLFLNRQVTAREIIAQLAAGVNGLARVNLLGQLQIVRPSIGTPALTLAADGSAEPQIEPLELLETGAPFWRLQAPADRCWRPHAAGEFYEPPPPEWSAIVDDGGKPADNATRNVDRGSWAAQAIGTAFVVGDEVQDQGSTWGALTAHTKTAANGPPTLPATDNGTWRLRARAGENGADGADGADGAPGEDGLTGGGQASFEVSSTAAGVVKAGQLPQTRALKLYRGPTDLTASASWAISGVTGGTITVGAATGIVTLSAITADTASAIVTATVTGGSVSFPVSARKVRDGAAAVGTVFAVSFPDNSSATQLGISNEIALPADMELQLNLDAAWEAASGTVVCEFWFQVRVNGGAWNTVGTSASESAIVGEPAFLALQRTFAAAASARIVEVRVMGTNSNNAATINTQIGPASAQGVFV